MYPSSSVLRAGVERCLFSLPLIAGALAFTTLTGEVLAASRLNDTGMQQCLVNGAWTKSCAGTGQDGEFGRDVSKPSKKDGFAGMTFVKVCNNGELAGNGSCPANPVLGSAPTDWACTYDKVTQLLWEVKTNDGGLRDWRKLYTVYGDGRAGEASEFVAKVNEVGLCNAKDWRLPNLNQLLSLVVYGAGIPAIDLIWFPNTAWGFDEDDQWLGYWTDAGPWTVYFDEGYFLGSLGIPSPVAVRLVRP